MKIDLIAGARPNFMKISPIIRAIKLAQLKGKNIHYRLVHTGQHYDKNMSSDFFQQLEIPNPDINFDVRSGTQAEQTAKIMVAYEKLLTNQPVEYCLVVGDVTSTMACAIVAKMNLKVIHVEAGLRSGDLTMPEEINRIVTDSVTDYFFTTSKYANDNLIKSSIPNKRIFFVGNTMIDTLLRFKSKFKKPDLSDNLKLNKRNYILMTLHRPSNVDKKNNLEKIINETLASSRGIPIIFPAHPRTLKKLQDSKYKDSNLFIIPPMSYLEFNYLMANAKGVITDSGGITEETTLLDVPCMTVRDSTERPETVILGSNELLGTNIRSIRGAMNRLFNNKWKKATIPPKWDGQSTQRIVDVLLKI